MTYKISQHAQEEMQRRNIPLDLLKSVLEHPQQVVAEKAGRKAYQSKLDFGTGKTYLLRAIVIDDVDPAVVVGSGDILTDGILANATIDTKLGAFSP